MGPLLRPCRLKAASLCLVTLTSSSNPTLSSNFSDSVHKSGLRHPKTGVFGICACLPRTPQWRCRNALASSLLRVDGAESTLQPEHPQEGSILEGADERRTVIGAHEAKCPSPPAVREKPSDDCPEADHE